MKTRWAVPFLWAAGATAFYVAVACENKDRRPAASVVREPIAVKVAEAQPLPERRLQGSGRLRAEIEIQANTPFPGTVKELLYAEGEGVAGGSVVAVVESKELIERLRLSEAALKRAHADLRESDDRLADTEKQLATTRELYGKDLIARRDVAEAETVVETARAEKDLARSQVEQREAAVAQIRHLLSLTRVTAPLSGIVTRRRVQTGDRVAAAAALMTIANIAVLSVAAEVSALDSDHLRTQTRAEVLVDAFPTRRFSGTITRVTDASASRAQRTVEVRVANPDGMLKPGMKVSVSLPVNKTEKVVVVPSAAVFELEREKYLYTVDGDNARLRHVDTAWEKAGQVAITSNLTYGEKVVISSGDRLTPDARIRIVE